MDLRASGGDIIINMCQRPHVVALPCSSTERLETLTAAQKAVYMLFNAIQEDTGSTVLAISEIARRQQSAVLCKLIFAHVAAETARASREQYTGSVPMTQTTLQCMFPPL